MATKTTAMKTTASKASVNKSNKQTLSKSAKRNILIAVSAVLIVTALVAAAIYFVKPAKDLTYGEFQFTESTCPGTNKLCYISSLNLNGQPYEIPFEHHPTEVENILFEYPVLEYLRATRARDGGTVIIGVPNNSPPSVGVAGAQLGRILGDKYGILNMPVLARISGTGEGEVSCLQATQRQYVILFEQATPSGVLVRAPNCIVVRAETIDGLSLVIDAYAYRILGIIPTFRSSGANTPLPQPPAGRIPGTQITTISANSTAANPVSAGELE